MLTRIEDVILNLIKDLVNANSGIQDNEKHCNKFHLSLSRPKEYVQTTLLLSIIYSSLMRNEYITKRSIYYRNPKIFCNQSNVDRIITKLCGYFDVCRQELQTVATSKSIAFGDAVIRLGNHSRISFINIRQGSGIPTIPFGKDDIESSAKFILIIEKDATLQKILNSNFYENFAPCLILTAKGYPDVATRNFLNLLCEKYPFLPIYALVDADPHGFCIYLNYKYGSNNAAMKLNNDASPYLLRISLLGVLPSEFSSLQIRSSDLLAITESDHSLIKTMKSKDYLKYEKSVMNELDLMEKQGRKAEIQCLDSLGSNFLCSEYLPRKLKIH